MNAEKLAARREAKRLQEEQERINLEKNQKPVKEIVITIEWKKSNVWGSNPNCEAEICFQDGTFERSPIYKCSGCGYDKESTVIADVFNDYLKYTLWNKSQDQLLRKGHKWEEENGAPYGVNGNNSNRYFAGGIGTSCYYEISKFIGGKFEKCFARKNF